jgi:hypothetical protein
MTATNTSLLIGLRCSRGGSLYLASLLQGQAQAVHGILYDLRGMYVARSCKVVGLLPWDDWGPWRKAAATKGGPLKENLHGILLCHVDEHPVVCHAWPEVQGTKHHLNLREGKEKYALLRKRLFVARLGSNTVVFAVPH